MAFFLQKKRQAANRPGRESEAEWSTKQEFLPPRGRAQLFEMIKKMQVVKVDAGGDASTSQLIKVQAEQLEHQPPSTSVQAPTRVA